MVSKVINLASEGDLPVLEWQESEAKNYLTNIMPTTLEGTNKETL
jgi:hypothetical protein